jgi:hypothetical protein
VARWCRYGLSVAGPFVCRCLTSRGPGRWPGQSGKQRQSHNLLFLLNVTGSSLEGWHFSSLKYLLFAADAELIAGENGAAVGEHDFQ